MFFTAPFSAKRSASPQKALLSDCKMFSHMPFSAKRTAGPVNARRLEHMLERRPLLGSNPQWRGRKLSNDPAASTGRQPKGDSTIVAPTRRRLSAGARPALRTRTRTRLATSLTASRPQRPPDPTSENAKAVRSG